MSFKLSNPYGAPAHQADAVISQADPVSTTLYTVLNTTTNVRIISIAAWVTWTVQPDPLSVVLTIDGNTITYSIANPVSATVYTPYFATPYSAEDAQVMGVLTGDTNNRPYLIEGRSVKVQVVTTGGTTSNLDCRVKYAKW